MNLIKSHRLFFRNEKSDKVYETELFQIGDNEYIVNFRFGRRGNALKEGTKTVFPVDLHTAEKLYDDLIASKKKKGYSESFSTIPTAVSVEPSLLETDAASAVITEYLNQISKGVVPKTSWKSSRIIWRAGTLKITECDQAINIITRVSYDQAFYACVWYCGRVSTETNRMTLQSISTKKGDLSHNIHQAGLIRYENKEAVTRQVEKLDSSLQELLSKKAYSEFEYKLFEILNASSDKAELLLSCYLLGLQNKNLQHIVQEAVNRFSLSYGFWQQFRYIYKIAEMIEDARMLGSLSVQIMRKSGNYNSDYYGMSYSSGRKLAFSKKTRAYFNRRLLRTLAEAGGNQEEFYCKLASEVLIALKKSDLRDKSPQTKYVFDNSVNRYNYLRVHYSSSSHLAVLYHILYSQSTRFVSNNDGFQYQGEPAKQTVREEAFKVLWDRYPQYAIEILQGAQLPEVIFFAFKVLENRSDLDTLITKDIILKLLDSKDETVLDFTLARIELACSKKDFELAIVTKLLSTSYFASKAMGVDFLSHRKNDYFKDLKFLNFALRLDNDKVHDLLRASYLESLVGFEISKEIVSGLMNTLSVHKEVKTATQTVNTMIVCFPKTLANIDFDQLIQLINSEYVELRVLACKLLAQSDIPAEKIPYELIMRLISDEEAQIQAEGMKLLSKFSDDELIGKFQLIFELATHDDHVIRENSSSIISRLALINTEFRDKMFEKLYPALMENHEDETFSEDIYNVIMTSLIDSLPLLGKNIDAVLKDNHREIHLLTKSYIDQYVNLDDWTMGQVALMADHDDRALRNEAITYFEGHIDRVKYEKYEAIKILDTNWQATREFAESFFNTNFAEKEWEPELIVSLCDNVREEVQHYGTRILGQYFVEENGIQYLEKLSEHPDPTIQLYTTNYLDRFAFGNIEMLTKLELYFKVILRSISKNSAAKKRVYKFLEKQALEGEEYGVYVSKILNELVNTIAIMDKAKCIILLRKIKQKYPSIETNVEIVPLEHRN